MCAGARLASARRTRLRYISSVLSLRRALLCAVLIVAGTGCDRGSAAERDENARRVAQTGLYGRELATPAAIPSVMLEDVDGQPRDLAEMSRGKLTLLFFGYTHCPDVCPVHMTNIAAALRYFAWDRRDSIRVVFVTTDPERDTPERLRMWMESIDPTFIALRGTPAALDRAQLALGLPMAMRLPGAHDGDYQVGHAGQVLAVFPDGTARYAYPFGIRQAEWAHDLPRLLTRSSQNSSGLAEDG
jgi:protein SCO1/2